MISRLLATGLFEPLIPTGTSIHRLTEDQAVPSRQGSAGQQPQEFRLVRHRKLLPRLVSTEQVDLSIPTSVDSRTFRTQNPSKPLSPRCARVLGGGVCTSRRFVADRFSRARKFSSSQFEVVILQDASASVARELVGMPQKAFMRRDVFGDPSSTTGSCWTCVDTFSVRRLRFMNRSGTKAPASTLRSSSARRRICLERGPSNRAKSQVKHGSGPRRCSNSWRLLDEPSCEDDNVSRMEVHA